MLSSAFLSKDPESASEGATRGLQSPPTASLRVARQGSEVPGQSVVRPGGISVDASRLRVRAVPRRSPDSQGWIPSTGDTGVATGIGTRCARRRSSGSLQATTCTRGRGRAACPARTQPYGGRGPLFFTHRLYSVSPELNRLPLPQGPLSVIHLLQGDAFLRVLQSTFLASRSQVLPPDTRTETSVAPPACLFTDLF